MEFMCLRIFTQEGERHQGKLLHHYLLDIAREVGASGATVLRGSAGFGRHGLREDVFFELGGDLPSIVEIVLESSQSQHMLQRLSEQGMRLFYTLSPVQAGITGEIPA